MVAGAGDPLPSSSLFLHGDSPALGEMWTTQGNSILLPLDMKNHHLTMEISGSEKRINKEG